MPEKRDIRLFLLDVSESIERIDDYISEMTYEDFLEDRKTIDAVVRNFEVIGEASKNIPDYFKDNYPDVNWKAMTRMRDKLIHGYFGVSPSIVWETAKNDTIITTRISSVSLHPSSSQKLLRISP